MFEVVVNKCHGGFGLSKKALEMIAELKGVNIGVGDAAYYNFERTLARHDKHLVSVVKKLGKDANEVYSKLAIVTIDLPVYKLETFDGLECIVELDERGWIVITD